MAAVGECLYERRASDKGVHRIGGASDKGVHSDKGCTG